MFSGVFEPCEMQGPCKRCLLYKPDQLLRVVPGRCTHSQTHRAAVSRIPQTPVRHNHAKAGRHEWSSALHPDEQTLPRLQDCSWAMPLSTALPTVVPQDPFPYTGFFNSLQEASSNASWSWSQTPTTPPSKAHPPTPHSSASIMPPFKPLYYFSIIH